MYDREDRLVGERCELRSPAQIRGELQAAGGLRNLCLQPERLGSRPELGRVDARRVEQDAVERNAARRRHEVGTLEPQRVVGARIEAHSDQV